MNKEHELLYYAWSPSGDCSDGFDTLEEAEDEAYYKGYSYVVVGLPEEAIDIVLDMREEDTAEYNRKDICDLISDC